MEEDGAADDGAVYRCDRLQTILDKLQVYNFYHLWIVNLPLDGQEHEFTSPVMQTRHLDLFDFSWRMSYVKSRGDNYSSNFTLALLRFDRRHFEVCVRCSLQDSYYSNQITEQRHFDFNAEPPILKEFTLWDSYIRRIYQERLVELLKCPESNLSRLDSVQLYIKVDFQFFKMDDHVRASLKLADDLETFLKRDEEHADVTFEIGGEELRAHKCILAARSPVFARMFEAQEAKYRIEDVEPDVFRHLLSFAYCGKINVDELPELRKAAERFGLKM